MRLHVVALMLVAALAAAGCETMRDSARWVTHVPKMADPAIDYKNIPGSEREKRLAQLFAPVDEQLENLAVRVSARETAPTPEWHRALSTAYPWISGITVLDTQGQVVDQVPDLHIKPFPAATIMALEKDWNRKKLRMLAQDTEFGPEIYLANPLTEQGQWRGLIVVHFDPRQLMSFSPAPDELIVLSAGSPAMALWPTVDGNNAQGLLAKDWPKLIKADMHGTLSEGGGRFLWLSRPLGGSHIVYAVREK